MPNCEINPFVNSLSSLGRNVSTLQWRHNGRDGFLNHRLLDCLLNRLFRRRSKWTSKLRVTGLCEGELWPVNSPHKGPVTRKMSPVDDVTMIYDHRVCHTGRDRLRLTALTTNHHGGGAKRRSCTFVVYRETRQRQHTWSRTDIVVHAVQLMWGIIWNLNYDRTIVYQGGQNIGWFIVSDKSKMSRLVVTAYAG